MAAQRPTRPAARGAKAGPAARTSYRGDAGRRQMEEEQVRQESAKEARKARGFEPFRFWTPVGETRQIVIIDAAPDFFRYEHALKDKRSGRFDNFLPCINEDANCPVCSVSDKPAYFGMYLSVIDLTPYINKDGDEVPWSKKMLVVKPAQQKKIARLAEKHGDMFGMILDMTRDGDKDAAIGNDIEFVDFMSEAEMEEFYSTYKDKDGKEQVIDGSVPFDYDSIYPEMTEEQLAIIAGVPEAGGVGNRRADDRATGRGAARGGREAPAGRTAGRRDARAEEDAPTRPARGAARRDAADEEGADDAPQRPARGAGRREAAPEREAAPARGAARRPAREPEPEPDDGYDDPPEDPPARPARGVRRAAEPEDPPQRPARGASRAPARGRADADHEDPPFEEDNPPPAAGRREALRGRRT